MGALGFICAVTICCLIVAITNWWDNRKEKEREASLHQDAAVRKMMTEPLNESKKEVIHHDMIPNTFSYTQPPISYTNRNEWLGFSYK